MTQTEISRLGESDSKGGSLMRAPLQRFQLPVKFKPIGLTPFFGFVGLFLAWPAVSLFRLAIQPTKNSDISAMREAITGNYLNSFIYTIKLSLLTALLGVLLGSLLAASVLRIERPKWFRNFVTSFAGVAANLGGIPLAFAFIAALGTQGLITKMIDYFGINLTDAGFRISNFAGITIVYLYFQIPLMFLIMVPAFNGLRASWSEAAASLGAAPRQYWRYVGLPLLTPALLGGFLLLFSNAFSAYATAYALSSGGARLVPVQIRFFLQGNTITGKDNLGYALAAWMIIIMLITMTGYLFVRRRAEKWQQ